MVFSSDLIERIFPMANARRGKQLYEAGSVYEIDNQSTPRELAYDALVADGYEEEAVSIIIDVKGSSLRSRCSCDEGRLCSHLAALMFAISAEITDLVSSGPADPADERLRQLHYVLDNYTVAQLRAIASRQGWKPKGTRKDAIAEQVAAHIASELEAGTFLDGLAPSQIEMLAALNLVFGINQGVTEPEIMHVNAILLDRRSDWKDIISGLVEYGVLFRDRETYENEVIYRPITTFTSYDIPATVYKLPSHRASRYPGCSQRPEAVPLHVAATQLGQYLSDGRVLMPNPPDWEPPRLNREAPWISEWPTRGDEVNALQDESPFFYLLRQQHLTLPINLHVVHPESRQPLSTLLGQSEAAEWLVDMLRVSGLISELPEGAGLVLNTERFEMWAQMPPEVQLQMMFSAWSGLGAEMFEFRMLMQNDARWELWRTVHPGLYYHLFMNDIGSARSTILRFLEQIAQQRTARDMDWFNLDTFIGKIGQLRPDFYHSMSGPDAWGFKHNNERIPYTNDRYWSDTYGKLIRYLFEGPLYWFGAVELLERKGSASAFRLTALGRWLLNPSQQLADVVSAESHTPTQLEWVNDDTVKIVPGSDLGNILKVLNRFASQLPQQRHHYQLDNARLEAGFANGETANSVIAAFEAIGIPFSDATTDRVRLVYQRYGSVHLYESLTVIEFSDDYALAELRAAKILESDSIIHEFSPRLVVIHDAHVDKITKALHKKNYTPRVM